MTPVETQNKIALWKMLIDGEPNLALSEKTMPVINPATEETIAEVPKGDKKDIDLAVRAAQKAMQGPWGRLSPKERSRLLFQWAALVRRNLESLAQLETAQSGKPITDCRGEAQTVADCFEYYGGAVSKFFGETIPASGSGLHFTLREPIGVCGLIVPWNYPMLIASWKLAPALACGNAVVLKPASNTPLTALRLAQLAQEAGIPKGVVNVVTGPGAQTGAALAQHQDVVKISFTGESRTGAEIMRLAGNAIKRLSLELGGKSAGLIFADCAFDACVEASVYAVFSNAGQDCCARSRLLVQDSIYEKFLEALIGRTKKLRVGDPLDESTEIGPLISRSQRERVMSYVNIGQEEGAHLATGVPRHAGKTSGFYLEPSVLGNVHQKMRVFQEEIFGPVACVTPFKTEEEAVALANNSIYGLSGSIWTADITRALKMAKAVKTGNLSINTSTSVHLETPFGGVKQSGLGRELGMQAMQAYSEIKTVSIKI